MTFQLRDYVVKDGAMDEWLREWRSLVRPLRERFGFQIVGAWVNRDENRFVWIIGHDSFSSADERYYTSPERKALDPDPARHLAQTQTTLMSSALD